MAKKLVAKDKVQFAIMKEMASLRRFILAAHHENFMGILVREFNLLGVLPDIEIKYVQQVINTAKLTKKSFDNQKNKNKI